MENFVGDCSNLNWDKLKDPCEDVIAKFTFLHDQLSKCVRRHVPLTKVSQKAPYLFYFETWQIFD